MSKVFLNVAERNMLRAVFVVRSGIGDIKTDDILEIAAITETLNLEEAETIVKTLEREVQHARMVAQRAVREAGIRIDKLDASGAEISDDLYAAYDAQQAKLEELPVALSYSTLMQAEKEEYDLDTSSLDWLLDVLKQHKWNQSISRSQTGEISSIKRTLHPDEAVVAASLVRSIKAAAL